MKSISSSTSLLLLFFSLSLSPAFLSPDTPPKRNFINFSHHALRFFKLVISVPRNSSSLSIASSCSFLIDIVSLSCSLRRVLWLTIIGVDIQSPALDVTPARLYGDASKDVIFCDRVKVSGLSRLELCSYTSSFRVTLAPSAIILEKQHSKIQVCFHRNASLGLCHCELDEWKALQKGVWSSVMSPYEEKYVDVKFIGKVLDLFQFLLKKIHRNGASFVCVWDLFYFCWHQLSAVGFLFITVLPWLLVFFWSS